MTRFEVSSSVQSADMEGTTDQTGKFGKRFRSRRSVSGRSTRKEVVAPMRLMLRWARESI